MKFVKAFCAAENLTSLVDFTSVGVKEHDLGRLSKGATGNRKRWKQRGVSLAQRSKI